jgi:hypothetical protein
MSYTGQTPDTEPAPDWRKSAACREEDPDLFFPKGYEGPWQLAIEQAKAVCRRCPIVDACLEFATEIGATDGIFGGLTEKERASVRRAAARHALPPEAVAARTEAARERQLPARERTLRTIFEDNTVRLYDGHLGWKGGEKVSFEGRSYTPKQVAFTTDRGRQPDGNVRTTCGRPRAECGTPSAYARHIRNGEVADEACKRAHAARSAQYRATGSTKASV